MVPHAREASHDALVLEGWILDRYKWSVPHRQRVNARAKPTDTKRRQLKLIADQINSCRACLGMHQPKVTVSAPGYWPAHSPVAVIGPSRCRMCMVTRIPFNGGSTRLHPPELLRTRMHLTPMGVKMAVRPRIRLDQHEKTACDQAVFLSG